MTSRLRSEVMADIRCHHPSGCSAPPDVNYNPCHVPIGWSAYCADHKSDMGGKMSLHRRLYKTLNNGPAPTIRLASPSYPQAAPAGYPPMPQETLHYPLVRVGAA